MSKTVAIRDPYLGVFQASYAAFFRGSVRHWAQVSDAEDGAAGTANNGVGVAAKARQPGFASTPGHHQIGIQLPGATGDGARSLAGLDRNVEVRARLALDVPNGLAGLLFQRGFELGVHEPLGEGLFARNGVHDVDGRAECLVEILGSPNETDTLRRRPDGADYIPPFHMLAGGQRLQMGCRPDRAIGIMQNLGGNGTEQGGPEGPVPARGHHDQSDFPVARQAGNPQSGVAGLDNPADAQAFECAFREGVHVFLRFGYDLGGLQSRKGERLDWSIRHDSGFNQMEQCHGGAEPLCRSLDMRHHGGTPIRKIDREKNALDFHVLNSAIRCECGNPSATSELRVHAFVAWWRAARLPDKSIFDRKYMGLRRGAFRAEDRAEAICQASIVGSDISTE
jgi:hypothetical protein